MADEATLARETSGWTRERVLRQYPSSPVGRQMLDGDREILEAYGYLTQSSVKMAKEGLFMVAFVRREASARWTPLASPGASAAPGTERAERAARVVAPAVSTEPASRPLGGPSPSPAMTPTIPSPKPPRPVAGPGDGAKQNLILALLLGGLALAVAGATQSDGANWLMIAGGILVAVGGVILFVMLFPHGLPAAAPKASELERATGRWNQAVLVRTYKNDKGGLRKANEEANVLAAHGYAPLTQSGVGSHLNLGRTATGAVLTGGLSLLFGGSRSKGTIQITYRR